VNNDLRETFADYCQRDFEFLVSDFGFRVESIRKDTFGSIVTYVSKFSAITLNYCPHDGWIKVTIFRILDGKIVSSELRITFDPSQDLFSFDFDLLTRVRANKIVKQKTEDLFDHREIERILSEYAILMKQYATDVLRGDFRIMPEIKNAIVQIGIKLKETGKY